MTDHHAGDHWVPETTCCCRRETLPKQYTTFEPNKPGNNIHCFLLTCMRFRNMKYYIIAGEASGIFMAATSSMHFSWKIRMPKYVAGVAIRCVRLAPYWSNITGTWPLWVSPEVLMNLKTILNNLSFCKKISWRTARMYDTR